MRHLHIDIETYSPAKLADCGVYRYAEHPDFRILLLAYGFDDMPTKILDLESLSNPEETYAHLFRTMTDPGCVKHAHNATFERVCLSEIFRRRGFLKPGEFLDPSQWECSMVKCSRCGLPMSLDEAGKALGLKDQKMTEGKKLIQLFSVPNRKGERVLPSERPEEWETFKAYCVRDVDVEREIEKALDWYQVSDFERELYAIDQRINDRGVLVDTQMAGKAVEIDAAYKARINMEAVKITGLDNPNSRTQLLGWIKEQTGQELVSLTKDDVAEILKVKGINPRLRRVMEIRRELNKTSTTKYQTMLDTVGKDDRVRGLTQFYGSRTGRWAGRFVQLQNLPQNHIEDLSFARGCVKDGDIEMLELGYGNVPDTLSQLIRTAFIAKKGCQFTVCDFSAIEARVLAWLAGEQWILEVFRHDGDIYCETASQMFRVPVAKNGPNAHLRQKGKVAVLALGYEGGVGALRAMGSERMGLSEDEMIDIVNKYRKANPHIRATWSAIQSAAMRVVTTHAPQVWRGLRFSWKQDGRDGFMLITLPSGRVLSYRNMRMGTNRFGNTSLTYEGQDQNTRKWVRLETYGGKLTENIVQAIARDCLAEKMTDAERSGFPVVFHVHDELIIETGSDTALRDVKAIFAKELAWAPGLPLKGAGYVTPYYKKD